MPYRDLEKRKQYLKEWKRKRMEDPELREELRIKNVEAQAKYRNTEKYRKRHEEYKPRRSVMDKKTRKRIRLTVIEHYSDGKNCCAGLNGEECKFNCGIPGKTDTDVLTIEHPNGGGCQHRKSIHQQNLYDYLHYRKYPEGYIILCMNCNMKVAKDKKLYGSRQFINSTPDVTQ